jgi:hypothetical protein
MHRYSVHGATGLLLVALVVGSTAGVSDANVRHVTPSVSLIRIPSRGLTMACSTLTLDVNGVRPSVTVKEGSCVDVVVPAWAYGSPTDVTVTPAGVLDQRSTALRADRSRFTDFMAIGLGTAKLAAADVPASGLMMPAWGGRIVVRSGGATDDHVPGRPTHVRATVQDQQVILTWRAPRVTPTDGVATDYLVTWQAPPMLPLTAEVDTDSAHTSYTSAFGPGTYTVTAKNASGSGPPSQPVTV